MRIWILSFALCLPGYPVSAQTATPEPSPAPQPAAAVWHNPPNTSYSIVDPCGGPKELLNKFGPTPCVYVAGEAMLSAGYANINTHGALQISGNGPLGLTTSVPVSGNMNVYPSFLMAVGVSANSQFQMTLPSVVDVHTQRFGSFGASTNPSFTYTQRVYFNQTKYTQAAVALGYTAPQGDAITSPGPAYQIQLDLAQPLSTDFSVGLWWTFRNAVTTSLTEPNQRGWSSPLGLYFAWSPANSTFEVLPIVYHDFNPNRTILALQAVQLITRRLSVAVSYGGAQTTSQSNGPIAQVFNFSSNASPRVVGFNVYYLVNQSDLPPQPPPAASPAPTMTP